MDLKKLKEFIKLAKEEGVTELEYEKGEEKYFVSLAPTHHKELNFSHTMAHAQPMATKEKVAKPNDGLYEITSPFVGTFYAKASPDSTPYIKVGDRIKASQILCIVEAMKIMNEIESDVSGEIVEVCVDNENYVEYGQTLFKIRI